MRRRLLSIITLSLLTAGLFVGTPALAASDLFQGVDCSKAPGSAVCTDSKSSSSNPLTGNGGIIIKVANIISIIAGVAAVIVIIVSGLKFITAGGEASQIATARSSLIGAIIGLVVIVLARSIIGLIIGRL